MKKAQKKQIEELTDLLEEAHEEIRGLLEKKDQEKVMGLLAQCQESAVQIGELVEKTEGENAPTIGKLQDYCELLYQVYQSLADGEQINVGKTAKLLRRTLIQVQNSVKNDIAIRLEMVFMPYKASMWDSLESVWMAADADPDCDAYVVPVPYYDKNQDGTFGAYHYEGDQMPPYVPVTHYDAYSLEQRYPDIVFIHNPYDHLNRVTSVDPRFYSYELKKYTECLVYIPYFATSGGMMEGQTSCLAYYFADYIVIQAESFRRYYDPKLPKEKLLPLGSPKFDKVMRLCQNPPEAPAGWKAKIAGQKVYFYNTSINGMLGNTEAFLKKMKYVFTIFQGREDACLLWRPHPLLESTFDSMRSEYKPAYEALRKWFNEADIGILDETSDIEKTIALSDAYIGDVGTSVTSLFGVAGKPIFILDNMIDTLPEKDDWRGQRISVTFDYRGDERYQVTDNNQLWFSEKNDYHYRFYMDLGTGYSGGRYYLRAMEIGERIYVIPRNTLDMPVIEKGKIRKVSFRETDASGPFFSGAWHDDDCKYIFLFPVRYPYVIRYHLDTGKIDYIEEVQPFYRRAVQNEWKIGAIWSHGRKLLFASPEDAQILFVDMDTLEKKVCSVESESNSGIQSIQLLGEELWLLPMRGMTITRWNPQTGEIREYSGVPKRFQVKNRPFEYECEDHPFGGIVFFEEDGRKKGLISPNWGNMYLSLDLESGEMEEWKLPMGEEIRGKNGYFHTGSMGGFRVREDQLGKFDRRYNVWYAPERRLYDVDLITGEYREIEIEFDYNDLLEHEPGFMAESEWMPYCLWENAFNSLKDFLDGNITGNQFDRGQQLRSFARVNANTDGTCGKNVYEFLKGKIS